MNGLTELINRNLKPISWYFDRRLFQSLVRRGLYKVVFEHCQKISRSHFEKIIRQSVNLENTYVEFYDLNHEFRFGEDAVMEINVALYVVLKEGKIIWLFIHITRND